MARVSTIAMAAAIVGLVTVAAPARAVEWPWCGDLYFGRFGTTTNCGFASFSQCEAYISGQSGFCYPNPFYREERRPRRRRRGKG